MFCGGCSGAGVDIFLPLYCSRFQVHAVALKTTIGVLLTELNGVVDPLPILNSARDNVVGESRRCVLRAFQKEWRAGFWYVALLALTQSFESTSMLLPLVLAKL